MFPAAFAYLIFLCGFSLAANDPCLAPICVVNRPCIPELPPCVRLLETIQEWKWVKIEGDGVYGVPKKEGKFNLKKLLATDSCQMTITVVSDAAAVGYCDFRRSNDSLKAFESIGKTYPVGSPEALRQLLHQDVRSSSPTTAKPSAVLRIIGDDDAEDLAAEKSPIIEEVRVGTLFKIGLANSDDTFEIQEMSLNTRVTIDGPSVVGFTISTEDQVTYGFSVLSSSGKTFIFKLQPVPWTGFPLEQQPRNHRFIIESLSSPLDLREAINHIQNITGNDTAVIADANDTTIVWIYQRYLEESICSTMQNHTVVGVSNNVGNVITRFEIFCTEEERIQSIIWRILLLAAFPVFPLVFLAVSFFRSEKFPCKLCGCSKLVWPSHKQTS